MQMSRRLAVVAFSLAALLAVMVVVVLAVNQVPSITPVTVDVGDVSGGLAVSPDGQRVFVTTSKSLVVIDVSTHTVLGEIGLGYYATDLALAPDGQRAYLPSSFGIEVVDLVTNLVGDRIAVGSVDGIATVSADGRQIVAVQFKDGQYSLITVNIASGRAAKTIVPMTSVSSVAITPDGDRAYLAAATGDPVRTVDLSTGTIIVVPESANSFGVAGLTLTPDGRSVYTITFFGITVINTATNTIVRKIEAHVPIGHFTVSQQGHHLFILDVLDNELAVFELDSARVVATVPIGDYPKNLALAPDGRRLYVVAKNKLNVIDVSKYT